MTSPTTPPSGQPDPAALLALGLATQSTDARTHAAPPLTPAELAAEFPQLDIIELLGRGGMGAVYKARQRDLDRFVALKILRPGLDADPGFAERFTREARSLAQLNHPGIVTLYEFGRTSAGRYFILMEFVDGMNLRQLLDAGRLSPREALAIVPPLCDALQYAHDRGLIHRDIKPENLLIDRLGRIKIADFGIARLASEGRDGPPGRPSESATFTSLGEVMGTPHYMAPEQRTSPTTVDHRADLYALGVVFYQMLTGELPAAGQLQPPSTRVHLDVRLDEIVLRALEKDPARRYAAAREFKTQVETVAHTHASPSPAAAPSSKNGFSYRSPRTFFGLPLLHVATGIDPATGKRRVARGIVAIGDYAQGIVAFGGFAMGIVSFGGFSLGLLGYGGLALGLLTIGGVGIGALASFSGLALAPIALGGNSIGWYAYGGAAWGRHVSSPTRHDPAAVDFFGTWAREFTQVGGAATFPLLAAGFIIMFCTIAWARKRVASGSTPDEHENPTASSAPLLPASVLVLFLVCFCGSLQFAAKNFPERVAIHFNMAGHPDASAERGVALLVLLVIGVGVSFFIPCLFALLRVLPAKFINIPHPGFWLAPERAAATHARLLRAGVWIAALNAAFFWGLQILSHWAHLSAPPRLPMVAFWALTGLFLITLTVWIIRLHRTFSRPDLAPVQPSPSPLARALRPVAPWMLLFLLLVGIIVPVSTALDILRADRKSTTVAVSNDSRTRPLFRFSPRSREITLLRSHPVAYDFDRERFVDYVPSPQSPHGIEASLRWHAHHGTDVFADPHSYLPGVLFLGTELAGVAPSAWDGPADEVTRHLKKPGGGIMAFIPAPAPGEPPATHVYRTPQGALVLVQLLRATDAGDVTLRYKAILDASSAPDPGANVSAVSPEDQRPLSFDRAGDTMQNIMSRLRHDHGLRISFENLDFTPADAKTAAQIIAEADLNAPYSKLEESLLKHARAAKDPNTLLDLGERYSGTIVGDSVSEFLARLTSDTPYAARKIGATWLIHPRSSSRLAFPITLKTTGMTVSEALAAIAKQAPAERPIAVGMVFAMPVAPGTDPTPWLSVQGPELEFKNTPAFEALCKLTETARPGSVWELAGYRDSRMLSTVPAPADEVLPVIHTAQAWLLGLDRKSYSAAWREASPLLRSEIDEAEFSDAMLRTRAPLGHVKARQLRSTALLTQLRGMPNGHYVLMQFTTTFDAAPAAIESVTFGRDTDGQWRSVGYVVNPGGRYRASDNETSIRINIIGAVNRSGAWLLPANPSLLDALAAAGGWTASANLKKISVLPPSSGLHPVAPSHHDVTAILAGRAPNPALPAEATITVSERLY